MTIKRTRRSGVSTSSVKSMKVKWKREGAGLSFKEWMKQWAAKNDDDPVTYAYAAARWLSRKASSR